jgi:hypothetical protein
MGVNEENCISCYLSNIIKVSHGVSCIHLVYLSLTLMHHTA